MKAIPRARRSCRVTRSRGEIMVIMSFELYILPPAPLFINNIFIFFEKDARKPLFLFTEIDFLYVKFILRKENQK